MLEYNLSKRLEKNISFHFIKWEIEYICENKYNVPMYSKTQIYSKKLKIKIKI